MEVLRRNTDYVLRMMVTLAKQFKSGELMSAKLLTSDCNFSYELGRKLLQRLHKAELVKSVMGLRGGFTLSRKPSEITLMAIINVLQGGIYLNKCLAGGEGCEFEHECEVCTKLAYLQLQTQDYLEGITLEEILRSRSKKRKNN
ncbi:MAG: Rrf2 family transcriptional regulator [Planctomycetes bacterium]|nr:Rrf2 family transcriptional regulator [Planctomycetota bacterium]